MALSPIMRDFLVRFQRTAIRETGRRPICLLRTPMEEDMLLPGCSRMGYSCWQPIAWEGGVMLGENAGAFHHSILEYLSLCQFLEIRFRLPIAGPNGALGFLYGRTFELYRNTHLSPPSRALEEAYLYQREHPAQPLAYCMAATCDAGEPILIMLRAEDGEVFVRRASGGEPLYFKLGLDRLLPKLQFVYDDF